ncbi:MAG: hypothetical protein FD130_1823 [Halothiobacillaceae bacterium]|nr:MAG: hypothetical protein FD130_1823 [Halothiobacillaceae bacterium]
MSFVLDASVTMAWLFNDESSKYTDGILQRVESDTAWVPTLWLYEVANVLVTGESCHRFSEAQARRFTELLSSLPIQVKEPTKASLWGSVLDLSKEHRLTAYDAAYLDLAMREGIPLATQDKALRKAARRVGVELL